MSGERLQLATPGPYLEVEDPCIVFDETLIMGYDSEKQVLVEGQASNGCEKPAVPCRQTQAQVKGGAVPPTMLLHFSEERRASGAHRPTSRPDLTEVTSREGVPQQSLDNAINRATYTLPSGFPGS